MGFEKDRRPRVGPGVARTKQTTVTNAQVLALFTTPVSVLPAPRAGKIHLIDDILIHKPAGTAYTVGTGGNIVFSYTNAAGLAVAAIAPAGFADQATAQTRRLRPYNAASGDSSNNPVAAAALVVHQATANMTAGTSPFKVSVVYREVPSVL